MVDVPSRRKGDGGTQRSKQQLAGSRGAIHDWRVYRDRLKIVKFLQIPGRRRLCFPVFILKLFAQEATAPAGVARDVLLLAKIRGNIRAVYVKADYHDTIAETGERDAKEEGKCENESHWTRGCGNEKQYPGMNYRTGMSNNPVVPASCKQGINTCQNHMVPSDKQSRDRVLRIPSVSVSWRLTQRYPAFQFCWTVPCTLRKNVLPFLQKVLP